MLEAIGLNAYYEDGHILHNVDFKIDEAERVAVLGRNGAGKSTFLKSLMNAGPRTTGGIQYDGADLGDMPSFRRARLGMSMVPEDRRIFSHLTVEENLAIAQSAAAGRKPVPVSQIVEAFSMLGPLVKRFGSQLSGGQQQILAVGRGLVASPRILLLDEPTEGLAPVIVEQMARELVSFCDKERVGLILCEQNIWFARTCTSRLYLIDVGRVVFEGTWEEFDAHEGLKQKYLSV